MLFHVASLVGCFLFKPMNEQLALKFLENFSLITVGENKTPNYKWKECQTVQLSKDQFIKQFNDPSTKGIGIVTGFDFLEVIDIDTKVFSTQLEMNEFWQEFYQTLIDTIIDFKNKFVVYKTLSGGYHILYKSKRCVGNTKIAVLKGHKEAIIETRGIGGYVFIYPQNKVNNKSYFDIEFITDEDRDTLWKICKSYNYITEQPKIESKIKKEYEDGNIKPWDEFNDKNDIWSVIEDDFTIPRNGQKNKHYLIKRYGSSAEHSGYVFRDSGCMYLFSTGTIYPHETLISPYAAYTYKYHNGNFSDSAKDLYDQGYGSRIKSKVDEIKPTIKEPKIILNDLDFPIDIFPKDIQFYLTECQTKLDSNLDYMGSSLIWLISICIGNSIEMEVKKGWNEQAVIWLAVVGKAGIGKTPSINNVIFPLMKENSKEIKKYIEAMKNQEYFNNLSKQDKEIHPEPKPAVKSQFIANDITLEALVELHQESDNAVGVFKDELAGWLKDMNKYRAGSDLEFWLSTWSGKSVFMNRKTAKSSFVEKPFIPVLGGIQPTIFNSFSTEENKENGFMDRMLLSFPDAIVDEYNDKELEYDTIKWYEQVIVQFYQEMKQSVKRDDNGNIKPIRVKFTPDAKLQWIRIFNNITNHQNNDDENEYLKSMYPKQKSYIPRFALLIHIFNLFFDPNKEQNINISKESILKAEKLSNYFVNNARKIKLESNETSEIKAAFGKADTNFDKLKMIYKKDSDFNRSKVAELIGVSRRTIQNWISKIDDNK